MPWMLRCLAAAHLACGLVLVLGVVSYVVLGVRGLPQLLTSPQGSHLSGNILLVVTVFLLPEMALGVGMLLLARWLW